MKYRMGEKMCCAPSNIEHWQEDDEDSFSSGLMWNGAVTCI